MKGCSLLSTAERCFPWRSQPPPRSRRLLLLCGGASESDSINEIMCLLLHSKPRDMYLVYYPDTLVHSETKCPPNGDFDLIRSRNKLIFPRKTNLRKISISDVRGWVISAICRPRYLTTWVHTHAPNSCKSATTRNPTRSDCARRAAPRTY